jgi:hypothetical protein
MHDIGQGYWPQGLTCKGGTPPPEGEHMEGQKPQQGEGQGAASQAAAANRWVRWVRALSGW